MLHFKAGIPYTQTLIWFGVLAYFWVKEEITYGKHRQPNRLLAMAGAWRGEEKPPIGISAFPASWRDKPAVTKPKQ